MTEVLSRLKLIEIENICLHEAHECARLLDTSRAIGEEGTLRNPPLAVQMRDGRYLIIDGAHRTGSLHCLGCRRVPVQVVEERDFRLEAWYHAVDVGEWLDELKSDPSLYFTNEREKGGLGAVAEVIAADGTISYIYSTDSAPHQRLMAWHRIVSLYSERHTVNRVAPSSSFYIKPGTVLMRYPACTMSDLEEVVMAGDVMPAGVTRFTVPGRLLNLRIPLSLLTAPSYEEREWEQLCEVWANSLRLYPESVYLCEV